MLSRFKFCWNAWKTHALGRAYCCHERATYAMAPLFFGPDTACRHIAGQVCLQLQIGNSKWCVPSSVWSWLGVTFQSLNI